jgi:hypothetical protein
MNYLSHDHNNALQVLSKTHINDIDQTISNCRIKCRKGNIPIIRDKLHANLMNIGWSPEVQIDPNSRISITSIKNNIGLCIQTGNMARMYADLLKLQTVFLNNIINGGAFIVPLKNSAKIMGDNIAHYERLINELEIFKNVITIPLLIFGFHE